MMEDPKHYTVTVRLRGYDQTPASMADLVRRSLTTHPTLGCRVDEVTAVEVPIVPPVRAGGYEDGFMEPLTEHDRAADAAFDADMGGFELIDATPEIEAAGCIIAYLAFQAKALGPPAHLPNAVPAAFQAPAGRMLARVGLDAWGRRTEVPVTAEPAPLGNWHEERGWEPATPADELRTLNLAIRRAVQAFARGDTLALATVNPSIQPLVDAALLFARTVGR
jgi:hypothetical protein